MNSAKELAIVIRALEIRAATQQGGIQEALRCADRVLRVAQEESVEWMRVADLVRGPAGESAFCSEASWAFGLSCYRPAGPCVLFTTGADSHSVYCDVCQR